MRRYSVGEAIGPAWERTKQVLRTGRWGSNFKMAFAAILAEMGSLLFLPVQMFTFFTGPHTSGTPAVALHAIAAIAVVFGLLFTAIYAILFFFGSRMQLTLVDLVMTRSHQVGPLWARHRQSNWRWMGVKLAPSLLFLCGLLPFIVAFARFQQNSAASQPGADPQAAAQAQIAAMHHAFAGLFAVSMGYMLAVGGALLLYSHLRDFVLPYLGIDQLPVRNALAAWLALWRNQPGEMTGYVFFRLLLLLAAVIGFYITLLIAVGVPVVLAILLGVGLKMAIHGSAGTVLVVCFALVAGLAIFTWYVLLLLFAGAAYSVFFQCYSLYFLGGRDPRIGALLEPETAVPVWTPPPSLPRDDDASGPNFPADPALA